MRIHVVIPHYQAHKWLDACLTCLCDRAGDIVAIDVVDMCETPQARGYTKHLSKIRANMIPLDVPDAKGGEPIPLALRTGLDAMPNAEITVTVDPDALVIRNNWAQELHRIFEDPNIIAAGINPRSYAADFAGHVEWNWCAFRTSFWREHIKNFMWRRVDIGQRFKDAAEPLGKRVHTFPHASSPFPGKPGAFVGDNDGLWAFHAFFSSRKHKDPLPPADASGVLTDAEENAIIRQCLEMP